MHIAMAAVTIALGAVFGLLFLICVVPFRLTANGAVHEGDVSGGARVDWAFGLLSIRAALAQGAVLYVLGAPIVRLRRRARADKRHPDQQPRSKRLERADGAGLLRRLMAFRRHRSRLVDMVARMSATVGLDMTIWGRVGTGDPANDAWLLYAMRAAEELPGVRVLVDVEWLEEELDVELEASAQIWLVQVLAVAVWILIHRQNRMALRAVA